MTSRGPDAAGEWIARDQDVAFGHRRLAIVDLTEGGAQPMTSADNRLTVTFNGEIYNYPELRRRLEADGVRFRSRSDTEVLLHLYRRYGVEMLSQLRGMFAFGLWDAERETLLLARDPYGIKPLYYADADGALRFASSVKALLAGGGVSRQPDPAGIVGYHVFGSVPEPWTTYKAIKSLAAGSFAIVARDGVRTPRSYYSLAGVYCEAEREKIPQKDVEALFREKLLDSVRHHMFSDVPVGAFLSGGVDSGALVGLMRDVGQTDICTVTLAFDHYRGKAADETPLAEEVAQRYGTRHVTRVVGAQEFHDDLPAIMQAMDQPSIDGINTWFVSKATKEIGLKVAISGIGGDELLGGYSTFSRLPRLVASMRRFPQIGLDRILGAGLGLAGRAGLNIHPKASGLLAYGRTYPGAWLLQRAVHLPEEMNSVIADRALVEAGLAELQPLETIARMLRPEPVGAFGKVAVLESSMYLRNQLLRDTDWAGMAHSVEIRTPLVDSVLWPAMAPILATAPHAAGKSMLANAPRVPLPAEIVSRIKTGFQIPIEAWHRNPDEQSASDVDAPGEERLWSRTWMKKVAALIDEDASASVSGP